MVGRIGPQATKIHNQNSLGVITAVSKCCIIQCNVLAMKVGTRVTCIDLCYLYAYGVGPHSGCPSRCLPLNKPNKYGIRRKISHSYISTWSWSSKQQPRLSLNFDVKKSVSIYHLIQYNAMQCNAMQCNAMQCNAIQYNTIK